jgi:large subunit ribosomal protein L33
VDLTLPQGLPAKRIANVKSTPPCRNSLTLQAQPVVSPQIPNISRIAMAKAASIKVKLVSSADTGYYYVTKKNSRTMTDKLVKKKYDPVAKKHVEFREAKIK